MNGINLYNRQNDECDMLDTITASKLRSIYEKMKHPISSDRELFSVDDALYSLTKTKIQQLNEEL